MNGRTIRVFFPHGQVFVCQNSRFILHRLFNTKRFVLRVWRFGLLIDLRIRDHWCFDFDNFTFDKSFLCVHK